MAYRMYVRTDYKSILVGRAEARRQADLIASAGGICEYLKGAVPRREPEGKVPTAEQKESFSPCYRA